MPRPVTIVSVADLPLIEQSIGREGQILAKTFPLDTGVTGVKLDFTWLMHGKGYGTNDVKWLWKRMEQEKTAGRKINSAALLDELDSKRQDGPPEWRKGLTHG